MKEERGTGEIRGDSLYTLREIRERLGLGSYAMMQARRKGLAVRQIGRKRFVLGKDVLDFLAAGDRQGVAHAK